LLTAGAPKAKTFAAAELTTPDSPTLGRHAGTGRRMFAFMLKKLMIEFVS